MKVFITLAVVCLIAGALATPVEISEERKAKTKAYFEECIKQEDVSEADIVRLRNKDRVNPSKNMKCVGTCMFEKMGSLKDGVFQEAVVIEKLTGLVGEEKAKAAVAKCKDVKGEDRCDTGFKLFECFESTRNH